MGLFYTYIFGREPGLLGFLDSKSHSDEYYKYRDKCENAFNEATKNVYTLTSPDNLKLKGFYCPASDTPSKKIAFIVHGYRSEHARTAGTFMDYYHSRGIDIFTVDNPAAGQSEGELITFDYLESEMLLLWIEFILMTFGEDTEIILHGFSLGGGAVLKISDRVPENVRFIIDDCGISGAPELLKPKCGILYPIINIINLLHHKLHFSLNMTDVRPNLRNAKCPILFVHGDADPTVPFSTGKNLYRICPTYKESFFVKDTLHMECIYNDPEGYAEKIDKFIKFFC